MNRRLRRIIAAGAIAVALAASWRFLREPEPGYAIFHSPHPGVTHDAAQSLRAILAGEYEPNHPIYDTFYASVYDQLFVEGRQGFLANAVVEALPPRPNGDRLRILDAGCGTGNEYRVLANIYDMVCLDLSAAMLTVARRKSPEGEFVRGDFREPSLFEANSFDAVVSFYSPVFYSDDFRVPLKNFHRWLKPGGVLFIDLMDRERFGDPELWKTWAKKFRLGPHKIEYSGRWRYLEGTRVAYEEKFLIDDDETHRQTHHMYYPTFAEFREAAAELGYEVVKEISLAAVEDVTERLFILRRDR